MLILKLLHGVRMFAISLLENFFHCLYHSSYSNESNTTIFLVQSVCVYEIDLFRSFDYFLYKIDFSVLKIVVQVQYMYTVWYPLLDVFSDLNI